MSRVSNESMSIIINSVDYSAFVDNVSVSGGTPVYEFVPVWNGRRKRVVTGYNEWNITLSFLYDTDIESLTNELTDVTKSYEITLGDGASVERTFSNMYVLSFDDTISSSDNLQMLKIQFVGEGIPDNKT